MKRTHDPRAPFRVLDNYGFFWVNGKWTEDAVRCTKFQNRSSARRVAEQVGGWAVDRNGLIIGGGRKDV